MLDCSTPFMQGGFSVKLRIFDGRLTFLVIALRVYSFVLYARPCQEVFLHETHRGPLAMEPQVLANA
jgi:hypothetical protein